MWPTEEIMIPNRTLNPEVRYVSPHIGLWLVFAVGVSMAVWAFFSTRFLGYWDDTIFVVALVRGLDGDPLGILSDLLSAPGDTYGPLLVGMTWLISETALMGNGLLNAVASLALLGLSLVVYGCSQQLGLRRWMSTWAALALLLTPALVDQRVWFISVQHTLTITLILIAVLLGAQIVQLEERTQSERGLVIKLVLLDLTFVAMAFAREVVLSAALFVTLGLLLYSKSWRSTLLISVGWMIPTLAMMRAVLTGRSGTQVGSISILQTVTDSVPRGVSVLLEDHFLLSFAATVLLVLVVQFFLLKSRKTHPYQGRLRRTGSLSLQERLAVTFSVALVVGTTLLVPRTVVLAAAALPGTNVLLDYKQTFSERWAMYSAPVVVILLTMSFLWLLGLMGSGQIPIYAIGASLASIAPYVGSDFVSKSIFGGSGGIPVESLSRYVVYVAPFGVLVIAWLLSAWRARQPRMPLKSVSLALLVTISWISFTATQFRTEQVQSVLIVREGPDAVRIVPSDYLRRYLVGYGETLPGQILKDVDAIRDDSSLTQSSLGGRIQWSP